MAVTPLTLETMYFELKSFIGDKACNWLGWPLYWRNNDSEGRTNSLNLGVLFRNYRLIEETES